MGGKGSGGGNLGYCDPRLDATIHPTTLDIAWAAGIWEGEGWCRKPVPTSKTQHVAIGQRDPWILYRLQALFGGRVYKGMGASRAPKAYYDWSIHGTRARGFLMTIYKFLSPHRKVQVRKALEK